MRKIILTIVAIFSIALCYGQEDYFGKLLLSANVGVPVEGAEVRVTGAMSLNTVTDQNGEFHISNVKYPIYIEFDHFNYSKKSFKVEDESNNVFLMDLKYEIEVSVVGRALISTRAFQLEKGSTMGPSMIKVRKTDVTMVALINRLRLIPGVQIDGRGNIIIRGMGSPLIVIDGTRFALDNGETVYDLPLVVDEIESIKVLKGGDASIYGIAGAEGVVVFTTIGGRKSL